MPNRPLRREITREKGGGRQGERGRDGVRERGGGGGAERPNHREGGGGRGSREKRERGKERLRRVG